MKDNPVLQGQWSYDEITGVLQKYEAQIYRVHPMNVNSSVPEEHVITHLVSI
jgi:hypothetical protein